MRFRYKVEPLDYLQTEIAEGRPHSCAYCRNIQLDLKTNIKVQTLLYGASPQLCVLTNDLIYDGARNGCSFFCWCLDLVKNEWPEWEAMSWKLNISAPPQGTYGNGRRVCLDSLALTFHSDQKKGLTWAVAASASHGDPAATYTIYRRYSPDPFSKSSIELYRTWLSNCCDNHLGMHDSCSETPQNKLPKRLLEIRRSTDQAKLRLVDVEYTGERTLYTALSYCWGTEGNMIMTKSCIAEFQNQISVDTLPPTLRDAVKVTEYLGFRYIWIDALCICQDDLLEKMEEIAKMKDIYAGAELTILASRASSVQEGFLAPRAGECASGFQLSVLCPDGGTGSVTLGYHSDADTMFNDPLPNRAWTTQEHILSSRAIAFCSQGARWFCRSMSTCEGLAPDFDKHVPEGDPPTCLDDAGLIRRCVRDWERFLYAYSKCAISLSSDRLLALSGIAEVAQALTDDVYLAGIWRSSLPEGLMWFVTYTKDRSRPYGMLASGCIRAPYRAPSWSWASLDNISTIRFLRTYGNGKDKFTYCLKILAVHMEPLHPDAPFGYAKSASIRAQGPMQQASWVGHERLRIRLSEFYDGMYIEGYVDVDVINDTVDISGDAGRVWCLKVGEAYRGHPSDSRYSFGLLLVATGSDTYQRVGAFQIRPFAFLGCGQAQITIV